MFCFQDGGLPVDHHVVNTFAQAGWQPRGQHICTWYRDGTVYTLINDYLLLSCKTMLDHQINLNIFRLSRLLSDGIAMSQDAFCCLELKVYARF